MHPKVVQYMLNDVLHNSGAYINGYSICAYPLCVLKYRGFKNATPYHPESRVSRITASDMYKKLGGLLGCLRVE